MAAYVAVEVLWGLGRSSPMIRGCIPALVLLFSRFFRHRGYVSFRVSGVEEEEKSNYEATIFDEF